MFITGRSKLTASDEEKISALVLKLQEKAEENVDLLAKITRLESQKERQESSQIAALNRKVREQQEKIESLNAKIAHAKKYEGNNVEQLNNIIVALDSTLNEKIEENNYLREKIATLKSRNRTSYTKQKLTQATPTKIQDKRVGQSLSFVCNDKNTVLEAQVSRLNLSLLVLEKNKNKKTTKYKKKIYQLTDEVESLKESNKIYEKRMKKMDSRMWDNLEKEARRRKQAEDELEEVLQENDKLRKKIRDYEISDESDTFSDSSSEL